MMLKIKKKSSKRSNPNHRPILTETGNAESEKMGRCIPIPSSLKSTKKKRLHTDFTDSPAVVPCKKQSFVERECKKVCVPPLNESRPWCMGFEVDDNVNGSNDGSEEDEIDSVDKDFEVVDSVNGSNDGSEEVGDDDKHDENDAEHESLENGQNCKYFSVIKSNELMQNSNCEHLLSQIPATEKKKWPQKRCVYCRKYGTRRDTRYICSSCNTALCKNPCFSEYHSCK